MHTAKKNDEKRPRWCAARVVLALLTVFFMLFDAPLRPYMLFARPIRITRATRPGINITEVDPRSVTNTALFGRLRERQPHRARRRPRVPGGPSDPRGDRIRLPGV